MYKYKYQPLHLPERVASWTWSRKRFTTLITVFLLITAALFIRHNPRLRYYKDTGKVETFGRPGVVYPAEDEWEPPPEWDPVLPVYENFTVIDDAYSSTVENLKTKNGVFHNEPIKMYNPYPDYESEDYRKHYMAAYVPCIGPRGVRLNESTEDSVYGYAGAPKDWPLGQLGSSAELGIDEEICFERSGRFGAYGLKYQGRQPGQPKTPKSVNWENVDWALLQRQCIDENAERFDISPRPFPGDGTYQKIPPDPHLIDMIHPVKKERFAVIFRSYDGMVYSEDMLRTMRAVIMELALASGGEYQAFLLVQVKDVTKPIFENSNVYEEVKQASVPKEFWNMTVLWNEALWGELYPKVPEAARNVHVSQWLPVQFFAQQYPNFDHYWNWEMDIRYSGHYYELVEKLDAWTKKQPRKGLWERNSRFYVPRYHGDYDTEYRDFIQSKYQSGSGAKKKDVSIWGPNPPPGQIVTALDDLPPLYAPTPAEDNFEWGVGESADLITLLPMFNPDTTHYAMRHGHYNYPTSLLPAGPPRRATIITFYRLSNRLLSTMHLENIRSPGHHMSAEQFPQGAAMHHGFKAVYAPHSIYMNRQWPAKALDFIFNNGDQKRIINAYKDVPDLGEGSGGWESVFGLDREHNFDFSTWYYRTHLANRFYRRLLGHNIDGAGGKDWEKEHGRYCLPPVLLHQIKDVEDPADDVASQNADDAEAKQTQLEEVAKAKDETFQNEKSNAELKAIAASQNEATAQNFPATGAGSKLGPEENESLDQRRR